ncbi:MAG: hypothetical protein JNL08_15385 [Planctomycetes bacterium]|nr:hypothetical protein [Planctomycetota bacterium]
MVRVEGVSFGFGRKREVVAFGPDDTLLLRDGARIDRVDVATGARTTLFPRSR